MAALTVVGFSPAQASSLKPLGHSCSPQGKIRFCPTLTFESRVKSFDQTPLDVDVSLPKSGRGPFPTIVMLHGYLQNKKQFESTSDRGTRELGIADNFNNYYFASRGYAVVNLSARGFGNSCGDPASRTESCKRGWLHFADQRYEIRDVQTLLGRLVDQGVADPQALAIAGLSYGGGQAIQLAFLKNRVRMQNGKLKRWRSPQGTPLKISAVRARWAWYDFHEALMENGRAGEQAFSSPTGVLKETVFNLLYKAGELNAFLSPAGLDRSVDLTNWRKAILANEPFTPQIKRILQSVSKFHSAAGIDGEPAPLMLENGWTDDIFPANEALLASQVIHRRYPSATVKLAFADIGHFRANNHSAVNRALNHHGAVFFNRYLKHAPSNIEGVLAFRQTCPDNTNDDSPLRASKFSTLSNSHIAISSSASFAIDSTTLPETQLTKITPSIGSSACNTVPSNDSDGIAHIEKRVTKITTMVGIPNLKATVSSQGQYAALNARLWDVSPDNTQRLISWGVYRLKGNTTEKIDFDLQANALQLSAGHKLRLDMTTEDPNFTRKIDGDFSLTVKNPHLTVPTE